MPLKHYWSFVRISVVMLVPANPAPGIAILAVEIRKSMSVP